MMEITGNFAGLPHGSKKTSLMTFSFPLKYPRLCHRKQYLLDLDIYNFWTRELQLASFVSSLLLYYISLQHVFSSFNFAKILDRMFGFCYLWVKMPFDNGCH